MPNHATSLTAFINDKPIQKPQEFIRQDGIENKIEPKPDVYQAILNVQRTLIQIQERQEHLISLILNKP